MQETPVHSWVGKIPWRRERLPTPVSWASLVAQIVKNPPAVQETWIWSQGWASPGGGHGIPVQYSCLENFHGQRLLGYSPWGCKESDTTERLCTARPLEINFLSHCSYEIVFIWSSFLKDISTGRQILGWHIFLEISSCVIFWFV